MTLGSMEVTEEGADDVTLEDIPDIAVEAELDVKVDVASEAELDATVDIATGVVPVAVPDVMFDATLDVVTVEFR